MDIRHAKTLAESQKYDSRNSPGFSGTMEINIRELYFVLDKSKITEVRFYHRAATTFSVYAGNSSDIT